MKQLESDKRTGKKRWKRLWREAILETNQLSKRWQISSEFLRDLFGIG